jgi:hypothetical protein
MGPTSFRPLFLVLAIAALLALTTPPLRADTISPGASVTPDAYTLSTSPSILDEVSGTFNLDGGALTGSYVEGVVVDPLGITCTGCLDFFIEVNENSGSTDTITRVGLDSTKGTATDVGYVVNSGNVVPTSVLEASDASTVSFFLSLGANESTDYMIIATDATSYAVGGSLGIGGIDSAGVFNNGLGLIQGMILPVATPEPGLGSLLSIGLLALAGCACRRKRLV